MTCRCQTPDLGFELPDVRATYLVPCSCGADECEEVCESSTVEIRIVRIWDKECPGCHGVDWRPEWHVMKDGNRVAVVPSESAAHAVVEAEWPDAESWRDDAWESERHLRMMGG